MKNGWQTKTAGRSLPILNGLSKREKPRMNAGSSEQYFTKDACDDSDIDYVDAEVQEANKRASWRASHPCKVWRWSWQSADGSRYSTR